MFRRCGFVFPACGTTRRSLVAGIGGGGHVAIATRCSSTDEKGGKGNAITLTVMKELFPHIKDDDAKLRSWMKALHGQNIHSAVDVEFMLSPGADGQTLWADCPDLVKLPGMVKGQLKKHFLPNLDALRALKDKVALDFYVAALRQGSREAQIFHPGALRHQRVGGHAFDTAVLQIFTSVFATKYEYCTMQDTIAVCLVGASGVGKTLASLCFPSGISVPDDMVFLISYIGFNTDPKLRLTTAELIHLSRVAESNEVAVAQVILPRLLASIVLLRRHRAHLAPLPGRDAKPIMKFDHDATLLEISSDDLRHRVVEEIVALAAEEKAPKVAILVDLDEAQIFDELVTDQQGNPEGARLCMRVLREVQLAVFMESKGKCVVLGLATGINPQLTLSSATQGENISITNELLSRDEFTELAKDSWPGKHHVDVFAAAAFPRVRQMLRRMEINSILLELDSPDTALQLIYHAITGLEMPRKDIPTQVHAIGPLNAAVPILDIAVWPSLLLYWRLKVPSVGALPWAPVVPFGNEVAANCYNFENFAFQVIGFTLELFWNPHPAVALIRESFAKTNAIFAEWVAWNSSPTGMFTCERVALTQDKQHYHPFDRCTSLEDACKGPLSEQVKTRIENMKKGTAVFFQTGGSAPLDYILVIRDGGGNIHVRYADAKHSVTTKESINAEAQTDALAQKANMVHKGLARCLSKLASPLVLDPEYTIAIVTNLMSDCDGVVQGTTNTFVLGPDTFEFPPWTDLLFRCKPSSD